MHQAPRFVRSLFSLSGAVAPSASLGLAWRLWRSLGKPKPLREAEADVMSRASALEVRVGSRTGRLYRWGDGPETIVLVHGWRGRAAQFASLVTELESSNRSIFAFDAPGNGAAPGRHTDIHDYVELISTAYRAAGSSIALISHSFGTLATFEALRAGVRAHAIASISGVGSFNYLVQSFARALGLHGRVESRLRRRIERELFDGDVDFWQALQSRGADDVPLLVVHDRADHVVDFAEALSIQHNHLGPLDVLHTDNLGHARILRDATVVARVRDFVADRSRDVAITPANPLTVTVSRESDLSPERICRVLRNATQIPSWAPGFADEVRTGRGTEWEAISGVETFPVRVEQVPEAGTVDILRPGPGDQWMGARFRASHRPGGGSVTSMTMVVGGMPHEQATQVAQRELDAAVAIAARG